MDWLHWTLIGTTLWFVLSEVLTQNKYRKLKARTSNLYERDNHGTFSKVTF